MRVSQSLFAMMPVFPEGIHLVRVFRGGNGSTGPELGVVLWAEESLSISNLCTHHPTTVYAIHRVYNSFHGDHLPHLPFCVLCSCVVRGCRIAPGPGRWWVLGNFQSHAPLPSNSHSNS